MSPSFNSGDVLIVNVSKYRRDTPRRGDIAIVVDPRDDARHSLKRVIGLPGEQVRLAEGMLWIDGETVAEPYLRGRSSSLGLNESAWELGPDEIFVMGDNRNHSADSRNYGPVSINSMIGKASACVWPPRRIGGIGHGN